MDPFWQSVLTILLSGGLAALLNEIYKFRRIRYENTKDERLADKTQAESEGVEVDSDFKRIEIATMVNTEVYRLFEEYKKSAEETQQKLYERIAVLEQAVDILESDADRLKSESTSQIEALRLRISELEKALAEALNGKKAAESREEKALKAKEYAEKLAHDRMIEINRLKRAGRKI